MLTVAKARCVLPILVNLLSRSVAVKTTRGTVILNLLIDGNDYHCKGEELFDLGELVVRLRFSKSD